MKDQFIMKRKQIIVLSNQESVDNVNKACDLMEKLTGKHWSVNKWFKKNAALAAQTKGEKNEK
ncbi:MULTISPECIES: hypothetical protein [Photorhabdus]|uniref:Uncharacterized protein n=1 Tax=Photorhabdus asymbiotica TaxID=291112 RepID=A0ABX9SP81_9GAMM|nr:hypothetical protein [Photorhabdus asymbiotica]RKS59847.1 hypothetical protein BDD30_1943 [Photorhabdus asymbiotica]